MPFPILSPSRPIRSHRRGGKLPPPCPSAETLSAAERPGCCQSEKPEPWPCPGNSFGTYVLYLYAPDTHAVSSSRLLFSLRRPQRNMRKTLTRSETGERMMRCSAGMVSLVLAAGLHAAAAQPFPASDTLTPQQLHGRNLFNQSSMTCHVTLQITSPTKYGPDLSKNALSGQEAVMREVISDGTPNRPGFKYHFEPDQIDAIVAYLKTLPVPAPSATPPR